MSKAYADEEKQTGNEITWLQLTRRGKFYSTEAVELEGELVSWKTEVKKPSRRQSTEVKGCGGRREPDASEFWGREERGSENCHNGS